MTRFFSVPKGKTDIWMVYDRTGSGLNKYLWNPKLGLTNLDYLLMGVGLESYFGDNELGELFLNFPLPASLHPYCEVDLVNIYLSNTLVH